MPGNFSPQEFLNELSLPLQEHKHLSFCASAKPAKIAEWANSLQATNITQTSIILYKSIPELNTLKTGFDIRMAALECVRPKVQQCIEGLTNEFLHQPLILPESAQKLAIVSQAMQKTMITGYLLCIRDISNLPRLKASAKTTLATALHRAMSGTGMFFFRAYQLYTKSPPAMWGTLHGLYQIAAHYELLNNAIGDSEMKNQATSIRDVYVKTLMLASCRANQLRQNDVARAFDAFSSWARQVKIQPLSASENIYVINLSKDSPPVYKSTSNKSKKEEPIIELDFTILLGVIAKHCSNSEKIPNDQQIVTIPPDFPDSILSHLLSTWGNIAQRKLGRKHVNMQAMLCVGLSDSHYYIAGKQTFENYVNMYADTLDNDSLNPQVSPARQDQKHPTWEISIQNVSPGGYCLLWRGDIPPRLEAGEVIGLKENHGTHWNLCVVRWIKQLKQASQLGVQLLSNHPAACGAAQKAEIEDTLHYMRAIALPANNQNAVAPSILTSKAPFSETQKVQIVSKQNILTIRLEKCIFSTGSVHQFLYRELERETHNENIENFAGKVPPPPNSEFDSSWDEI